MWTYRCYDDGKEPNLWQRWYDENVDFQGTHDSIFEMLEDRLNWGPKQVDYLDHENRIIEVRLNGNPKHRILGCYGWNERQEFIVLGACTHKQRVYYPHGIKDTVVKRKQDVESNLGKAPRCVRPQAE